MPTTRRATRGRPRPYLHGHTTQSLGSHSTAVPTFWRWVAATAGIPRYPTTVSSIPPSARPVRGARESDQTQGPHRRYQRVALQRVARLPVIVLSLSLAARSSLWPAQARPQGPPN